MPIGGPDRTPIEMLCFDRGNVFQYWRTKLVFAQEHGAGLAAWQTRTRRGTLTPLFLVRIQVPQPYNTDRAVRRGCCASDPWRATLSVRSNLDFGSDNRRARPLCAPCAY
jgi:hypothetical protein